MNRRDLIRRLAGLGAALGVAQVEGSALPHGDDLSAFYALRQVKSFRPGEACNAVDIETMRLAVIEIAEFVFELERERR